MVARLRVRRENIVAALLLVAGCAFPPDLGNGQLRCGAGGSCPPAYHCAAGRCFKSGGPDQVATGVSDLASGDFSSAMDLSRTTSGDLGACVPSCAGACSSCCRELCDEATSCNLTCPAGSCDCELDCSNTKSCAVRCGKGDVCTGTIGNAGTATLTCATGSRCDFTCGGASSCMLDCRGSAQCSVTCTGAAKCMVSGMCVSQMSCPNSNTIVCNRACP
jgi:hypothetical protein